MAEDKKIRVSADLSEMRRLRDEIVSLYRDINNSEEKSRQATEQSLNQLRQQLSLMTDRVSLEKMLADLRQQQSGAVYNQGENSITWDIQPEEGGSRKAPAPRRGTQAAAMSDLANIMRDVEKSVVSIRDYLTSERPAEDKNSSEDIFIDIRNNIRDLRQDLSSLSRERVRDISNDEDKNSNKQIFQQPNNNNDNIDKILGSISTLREKLNSSLEGINASNREIVNETKLINRYLDVIGASVSIIEDNSTSSGGVAGRGVSTSGSVKGGIVGGLVATLSQELLKYGRQFVDLFGTRYLRNQRAEAQAMYTDPISNVGLSLRTRGANEADYFRWIPIVGKYIAQSIETKYETQGEMAMTGLQTLRQTQNQLVSLAQTMGLSISGATGIASREGSYAARALGMNIGEYGERRAQLLRASGGRIRSASEAQSLMAAERLFGISPSAINALQGSMRFNTNERTTGSEVISIFERTMRELRLPFEEIASTIEESLTTFNQTSERILSRTGEVDAVRLTSALAGIRSFTGARGRQLERYQQAFTGQNISNDENTRALLMRSFFELNPGAQLSDFKVMQDNWTQGRGLDTLFYSLNRLQELTGGNKQATFTALEQMFPGLSATDIEGLFKEGSSTIDFKELQAKIEENIKEASENELTYSKNIAKSITGIEGEFKSYDNRMLTIGGQSVGLLQRILAEVEMMNMKMDPGEQYWAKMKEKTKNVDIFSKDGSDYGTSYRREYSEMLRKLDIEHKSGNLSDEEFETLKERAYITAKARKLQILKNARVSEMTGVETYESALGEYDQRTNTYRPKATREKQAIQNPDINAFGSLMFPKAEFDSMRKSQDMLRESIDRLRTDFKTMTIELPN